jgi:hypothetical protein
MNISSIGKSPIPFLERDDAGTMRICAFFVTLPRAGGAAAIAILYKPAAMLAIDTPACGGRAAVAAIVDYQAAETRLMLGMLRCR